MPEPRRRDNCTLDPSHCTLADFESLDPAMQRCLELARVASDTKLPVLVLGESGTGKTLLARAIHNSSSLDAGPFVSFNAAALSETLVDSQLFGHERGAFTGAHAAVKGKFEMADGGTLFIDEIADMSPLVQAKILRAIEYGEFDRLGSTEMRHATVRLISATHLPLGEYMKTDRFRKDLFYRLRGITLTLPPLRERPTDLRSLIAAQVRLASTNQGKQIVGIDRAAMESLLEHPWPGNLRELNRVVQAAVAMTSDAVLRRSAILLGDFHHELLDTVPPDASTSTSDDVLQYPSGSDAPAVEEDLTLREVERQHIQKVLEHVGGNKRQAAKVLGIARSTLDRKLSAVPEP